MKCPMCSGKGMVDYPMYADDEHKWQYCVARMKKCDMCNGTGEVHMTNEEWRRTCSTEEFAKWMAEEKMCRGYFIFPSMEEAIQDALDWLKEKHEE